MAVFPPPTSFSSHLQLGIVTLLLRCQGEITGEIFKILFSLFIPIMIIRIPKIQESCIHIPFNLLFITISIYVFTTKVKPYE